MTARPMTPVPKTATVEPFFTFAVFSTAPHPAPGALLDIELVRLDSIIMCM